MKSTNLFQNSWRTILMICISFLSISNTLCAWDKISMCGFPEDGSGNDAVNKMVGRRNTIYIGTESNGVYSFNTTNTETGCWTAWNTGLPPGAKVSDMTITSEGYVYVIIDGEIYY